MNNLDGIINFTQWPRTPGGEPILTSTEDALFYANLIFSNADECFNILRLRYLTLFYLENYYCKDDPDYQEMMDLAVKAQLYRECLEEVRRIRIDNGNL